MACKRFTYFWPFLRGIHAGHCNGLLIQWRHDERDGVSYHHRLHGLLNRLSRRRSKKTSKPRGTSLYEGNSLVTGEFPSQKSSNADNVSICWRYREYSQQWPIAWWLSRSIYGLWATSYCLSATHIVWYARGIRPWWCHRGRWRSVRSLLAWGSPWLLLCRRCLKITAVGWCHGLDTFSALLSVVRGNQLWSMVSPHKRSAIRNFGDFFILIFQKLSRTSRVSDGLGSYDGRVDGLVQEKRYSIANALEVPLFWINPPMWRHRDGIYPVYHARVFFHFDFPCSY